LRDLCHHDEFIRCAVTRSHHEHARAFFLDPDIDIHFVFIRSLFRLEIHLFKISQPAQIGIAASQFTAGIEIPFHHVQLTTDDLVPGDAVPGNVDVADINRFPLGNLEINVNQLLVFPRIDLGIDFRVGVAFIVAGLRQKIQVPDDGFPVVIIAFLHFEGLQQRLARLFQNIAGDGHIIDFKPLAFLNFNFNVDAFLIGCGFRFADLSINKSVIKIIGIDFSDILLELVTLEQPGIGDERKESFLRGAHQLFQFLGRKGFIPFKRDRSDVEPVVFPDLQNDTEICFPVLFHPVFDLRIIIPLAVVERFDLFNVCLDLFPIQALPGFDG